MDEKLSSKAGINGSSDPVPPAGAAKQNVNPAGKEEVKMTGKEAVEQKVKSIFALSDNDAKYDKNTKELISPEDTEYERELLSKGMKMPDPMIQSLTKDTRTYLVNYLTDIAVKTEALSNKADTAEEATKELSAFKSKVEELETTQSAIVDHANQYFNEKGLTHLGENANLYEVVDSMIKHVRETEKAAIKLSGMRAKSNLASIQIRESLNKATGARGSGSSSGLSQAHEQGGYLREEVALSGKRRATEEQDDDDGDDAMEDTPRHSNKRVAADPAQARIRTLRSLISDNVTFSQEQKKYLPEGYNYAEILQMTRRHGNHQADSTSGGFVKVKRYNRDNGDGSR
jgi:hypothetical protein